jgi:hypothetical protein
MNYLIGVITALVIAFFYQKGRTNVAEARNDNLAELKTVDQEAVKVEGNNTTIASEQSKQDTINKEITDAKKDSFTLNDDNDFISKR